MSINAILNLNVALDSPTKGGSVGGSAEGAWEDV